MNRKLLKSALSLVFIFLFSAAAFAQGDKAQADMYEKFIATYKSTTPEQQKVAYDLGKEYLSKYGAPEDQYNKFVRTWVGKYEKALLDFNFEQNMTQKNYKEGFRYGKEILAAEPERLDILIPLGLIPVDITGGEFDADAVIYAQKSIKLIEAGKQPEAKNSTGKVVASWLQFSGKDDALAALSFALGAYASRAGKPAEAAVIFHRIAAGQSSYAKQPSIYLFLGNAYLNGDYKKYETEYNRLLQKTPAQSNEAETKAALDKAFKVLDLVIDAYARAVALSNDPKDAAQKASSLNYLTTIYKARHNNSDAGLKEMMDKILSQPIPQPGF